MDKLNYLTRIDIAKNDFPLNIQTLRLLQKNHLLNVPFENLDIHWKNPIILDTEKFFDKIIDKKRGGFCYELNGLFNELLKNLGFQTKIISARVSNGKDFGAEYDHLAILAKIDGEEFLVDVGFGDFSAKPLKFVLDTEQIDENGTFLVRKYDENYFEVLKKQGDEWQSEYIFKDITRNLSEFTEMCNFHQSSPHSHFTRGKLCSLMTENGRKTLTDKKFIKTENGEKFETEITSESEFNEILASEFQIYSNLFGALGNWRKFDEKFDEKTVKQVNDASCVSAIGEMLAAFYDLDLSQKEILEAIGVWANSKKLAEFLNSKETRTDVEWIGGAFPFDPAFIKGISRRQIWAVMLREGNPLGHAVLIRGLDEKGFVVIEDPFDQTNYKMTEEDLSEVLSEFVLRREKRK